VGSPVYAEDNDSYGATTLTADQVAVDDIAISLDFPGKGGKRTEALLADAKVVSVIQECEEINGQFLFCYRDDSGNYHPVSSSDVNIYLREVTEEPLSAKDFRTWSASVMALKHLKTFLGKSSGGRLTTRAITQAIEKTAGEMGHTKTICRQSYIHPGLLAAASRGTLSTLLQEYSNVEPVQADLTRDEVQFLAIVPALTT
jgi:DNA topoisomerase-1